MNQKLADYIKTTNETKNIMNQAIEYAEANKTHVAYAIGKVVEKQTVETLVKILTEIDEEEYILTDQSKTKEQREVAENTIINTLLKWFPAIGQDMKQFVL